MERVLPRKPALTICIPTYNRGKRVHALVLFLKQNLVTLTDDVEIVVVNNCSSDSTRELIEPLTGNGVKLYNRTEFLETAELNMFHSLELCSGEFVWYHGDDDIPTISTIMYLISMIREDAADLYVFNSPVIDDDGQVLCPKMVSMRNAHLDVSADQLIETAGFGFMLAGISNVIFRREYADIKIAWEAQSIQPLYAHVCWFLACFAHRRSRIVNMPLVYYRNSDGIKQVAHFKKVAARLNVADHHFWGIGMALQFKWLVDRGVITGASLPRIFEGRRDGTRFKLLNECIHKIYTQVSASVIYSERRFQVDSEVLIDVRNFLVSCDLFAYDLFEPILQLHEIAKGQRSGEEFEAIRQTFDRIHRLHDANVYRNNWQGDRYGYQIYRMACQWVAVKPEIDGGVIAALSVIDLEEQLPLLLLADDLDTLAGKAAEQSKTALARASRRQPMDLMQRFVNEYASSVELHRHAVAATNRAMVDMYHLGARAVADMHHLGTRNAADLQQLGEQHIEIMHRIARDYSGSVQIDRQATLLVRKLTYLVSYPVGKCLRIAKRLLAR
jgi:glycosyltransferase involved in cell wall biosynthesis